MIQYTVKYGDTLYEIAKRHNTTVEAILRENPYLSPYNLSVGAIISIPYNMNEQNIITSDVELVQEMNRVWQQHVMLLRALLVSITENLDDVASVKERLLRNARDIAKIYEQYYGREVANNIERLLTEHINIAESLIIALKDGNTAMVEELEMRGNRNSEAIAEYLSGIDQYYSKEKIKELFDEHLRLFKREIEARLMKDYSADIAAYDMLEQQAQEIARYLLTGLGD